MKKFLLFFLTITVLLSSCKKEDDYIFDQSPDERINASIAKYNALLTGAANGWKAYITVDNGEGATYAFYFRFNSDNRVKMVSDFDTTSAVTLQESSFRIRQQQQPTLIFDTYSYVHVLADPNEANAGVVANVNGGAVGQGLLSDFEFIFDRDSISADTLKMVGKVNGAKLTLIRATEPEATIFENGQWDLVSKYFDYILTYYRRLIIDGTSYDVRFDSHNHDISFGYLDGAGDYQIATTKYYNTTSGLTLTEPFVNGSTNITSLSVDNWNPATNIITVRSGAATGTVGETILPLKVNIPAAAAWLKYASDNFGYWASVDGFHVNGVDDAYNINSIADYYFLAYFPSDYFGTTTDVFCPVFFDGSGLYLDYYSNMSYSFDAAGIGKFRLRSSSGFPANGPARLTRNLLVQTQGFYFVPTSETTYDMVSAKDGKAWLTWFF
ncbi:DUF4302 domain-containing protein [Ferruginibacter sp. SUN002]|uniref:DUF4302 domain-containing protein n=1 Tax=Ferruginibacter sp. SUN002 TaxID=2937789 RepID=UPI003D3700F1